MRARFGLGLCLGLAAGLSFGAPTSLGAPTAPTSLSPAPRDSARVTPPSPPVGLQSPPDSLRNASSKTKPDSVSLHPKSRSDTVIVAKHQFNHREQIITGSLIMTCLAVMLVAMNNYNPR
jgi:hypothetical protein